MHSIVFIYEMKCKKNMFSKIDLAFITTYGMIMVRIVTF